MLKINIHSKFFRDRLILVSGLLSLLVNIILWIILLSKFGYSQEPTPLHFSVIYGIDFVGPSSKIYQIPFLGLVIFSINTFLSRLAYEREKLFSYFLLVAAAVSQIILFIAALSLISLG